MVPHELGALLEVGGDPVELRADDEQVERQAGDEQDDVDDREHDQAWSRPHLPENTAQEQVVLEALGEHGVDRGGGLADQRGVGGVGAACSGWP